MEVSINKQFNEAWIVLDYNESLKDVVSQIEPDNDYHYDNIEIDENRTSEYIECNDTSGLVAYYEGTLSTRQGILKIDDHNILYIKLYQYFAFYKHKDEEKSEVEFFENHYDCDMDLDLNHTDLSVRFYRKTKGNSYGTTLHEFYDELTEDKRFSYDDSDKKWLLNQLKGDYTTNNLL